MSLLRALPILLSVVVVMATFVLAPPAAPPPATRPLVEPTDGYVGSAACRACHAKEHATWYGSYHRTMTQVASRASLVPKFERLQLDWFGKPVVLEWRGDTLWAVFERGGLHPAPVERPVEQLTGSHHLQVLWYSTGHGRELAPVPMGYKLEEGLWLPLTSVFVLPPEFRDPPEPGAWSQSCSACHATATLPRLDLDHNDTHVSELGIACEACHGPGGKHLAANQNPLRRYGHRLAGADPTMVDPQTQLPVRSAQLCGQCHAVSILRQAHFERWRDHGSPFRPGADLHATHLVIGAQDADAPELRRELVKNPHFVASSFWSDGEVRLSGREFSGLRQSPCYTHGDARRQLDCTSCHELHPDDGLVRDEWRDDQLRDGMRGNVACTQCHEALAVPAALAAHTHHRADSAGSRCYDCHMPHTAVGLMKTSRSHQITSPSVQKELATGRPNACNLCHVDRTLAWTAEHLKANWGIESPALDDTQRTVAAGVGWLLTGDAGQRVLAVSAFGRAVTRETAGTTWMAPFVARLLDDPYYVVRFQAARALRSFGDHGAVLEGYDFLAEAAVAARSVDAVTRRWAVGWQGGARPELLLDERGVLAGPFGALYARRNNRPVYLAE